MSLRRCGKSFFVVEAEDSSRIQEDENSELGVLGVFGVLGGGVWCLVCPPPEAIISFGWNRVWSSGKLFPWSDHPWKPFLHLDGIVSGILGRSPRGASTPRSHLPIRMEQSLESRDSSPQRASTLRNHYLIWM